MHVVGIFSFLSVLVSSQLTSAHQIGAPTLACQDMRPKHLNPITSTLHPPQTSPYPFHLHAEQNGAEVLVHIMADADDFFEGFFLQARNNESTPVGTFVTLESQPAQVISCPGGINNAVTHDSSAHKTLIEAYWTPPGGNATNITFMLSTVRHYEEFWIDQTLEFAMLPSAANIQTQSIIFMLVCTLGLVHTLS